MSKEEPELDISGKETGTQTLEKSEHGTLEVVVNRLLAFSQVNKFELITEGRRLSAACIDEWESVDGQTRTSRI